VKIFWDGLGLSQPASGVYVYAQKLAEGLVQAGIKPAVISQPGAPKVHPALDYVVLSDGILGAKLSRSKPLWPARVGATLGKRLKPDEKAVLHGLSNLNLSLFTKPRAVKTVLTVHDVIPLIDRASVSTASHWQLWALLPQALRAADRIVCVSEWTRKTLLERYPNVAAKTSVIHNGVEHQVQIHREKSAEMRVLMVARSETYKRLDQYLKLVKRLGAGVKATLVTDQKGRELAEKLAKDEIAAGRLQLPVDASHAELARLYEQTDVYVHTSRYEGFCLPAADALAKGCPVVYQRGTAIDEVAGDEAGFPLAAAASLDDWAAAVKDAYALSQSPRCKQVCEVQLGTLPSWKDAALVLKNLYNDLTRES
jgi:glycosyltransferase involved in cell wall biosynthesis